ncbi:uncharacterized protein EI90DRAFT_3069153 [Cantharellus anzutake]|uniref:uncharacterized protein n=1 Tax=Cantharellus anzutake TaxID=1750568 RepID=UPI001903AFDB|nr:uncharacterized protein EI90DRAFT_3078598 [Cantharellus anzutake]XP_038913140.1 uncharacterized protein EI90DRAFT_3069153 [Cantharellus anzutake]KAF8321939.1 hypothetical protein EI90DRAFT_3078598 [Cantharellus anzutake]KAF8326810.1 hypothetical protein EI90DRAFT_3069153 [Cantharellus anzutake]
MACVHSGDPAVKQILVHMNASTNPENHFIVQDLDDTHLLIKADVVNTVLKNLEVEVSMAPHWVSRNRSAKVAALHGPVGEEHVYH